MNDIPVVFIIFNRPETTKKVFSAISQARPKRLFIIADGPRLNKPGEMDRCLETRSIAENVNWDCEVRKNYSEVNLGCALRISSGLQWVFELSEAAIILEDDCLPDQTFFLFCQELLLKYWDDSRIFSISGSHLPWFKQRTKASYFFSSNTHVWGWATWRRSWKQYDMSIRNLPELIEGGWLSDCTGVEKRELKYYIKVYNELYRTSLNPFTWDYQFGLCGFMNGSHIIVPNVNMVSNIGFGIGESHSNAGKNVCAENPTNPISFPLIHPLFLINDTIYDRKTFEFLFKPRLINRLKAFSKNPMGIIKRKVKRYF